MLRLLAEDFYRYDKSPFGSTSCPTWTRPARRTHWRIPEARLHGSPPGKQDPVEQGIGYLTKKEGTHKGLRVLARRRQKLTGRQPNHLSNDDRVIACHRAWMRGSSSTGVKSSLTSLCSASAGFCELMTRAGKDSDALLVRGHEPFSVDSSSITRGTGGFLLGIHHDRQHIHAHILPALAESGRHEGHRQ